MTSHGRLTSREVIVARAGGSCLRRNLSVTLELPQAWTPPSWLTFPPGVCVWDWDLTAAGFAARECENRRPRPRLRLFVERRK